jgi:hypothetical protein
MRELKEFETYVNPDNEHFHGLETPLAMLPLPFF